MDNAASFSPLIAAMPEIEWAAVDLPGHGKSGHFPAGQHYHLIDQVAYVLKAADALGWDDFTLVGHSLGGCIAPFVAVAAPHRVRQLVLLEALGPLSEEADALPDRLKRSTAATNQCHNRLHRLYASVDDAVQARLAATRMLPASARLIVKRSLESADGGFVWRYDPRIRAPSNHYLTERQVRAVLKDVAQPTLCILAQQGFLLHGDNCAERTKCLKNAVVVKVNGHHHMHMDDPEATAAAMRTFFLHN